MLEPSVKKRITKARNDESTKKTGEHLPAFVFSSFRAFVILFVFETSSPPLKRVIEKMDVAVTFPGLCFCKK